jgi:3-oxoacyl-[acyl-carrier-protein] synthase-3
MAINSVITGTGSYIPTVVKRNSDFLTNQFLNEDGTPFGYENGVVIEKFKSITGIQERRYASPELNSSDLAFFAAEKAIADSKINQEELDYIILAHNFGDVNSDTNQSDILPSLSSRVKHKLGIKNPNCVAYDILFGCPGWIQGMIQAEAYIKSGVAKKCLVIGTETLSRVLDDYDRDSMIYSDGAGACVVEAVESDSKTGILSFAAQTHTFEECYYLFFGKTYDKTGDDHVRYIKMYGRKIYEFGLNFVPLAMKKALDKSGIDILDVKKILIHQANEKMDEAIIKRFYRLYNTQIPDAVMPMSIHTLGNSSVATVITLYDLIKQGNLKPHSLHKGDVILMASVGAGMNINAMVYKY